MDAARIALGGGGLAFGLEPPLLSPYAGRLGLAARISSLPQLNHVRDL